MLSNEKTLQTLEFNKIREMLASCAYTEGAKEMALSLLPSSDPDEVLRRGRRTTDARRLIEYKGVPPFGGVRNIVDSCERADKGATLSTGELLAVANVLRTSRALLDYIHTNTAIDTCLDVVFDRLIPNRPLEDKISRSIISEEMIADEASRELGDIRRRIRIESNRIKETLQKYISGGSYAKYLRENIVTMKNGRYVVPVKAECKNEIKGMIHDTSATGSTIFIEPAAVVDANNEIRILQNKEEHEIERILRELSADVAAVENAIRLDYLNITELAFVFACGQLSVKMDGVQPKLSGNRTVYLHNARHPLIDREKVVPVDIRLGGEFDTLIITGPNTGGKTVTLKTIGLFALMAQAGLHLPADSESTVCLFDDIEVDIGDEQSIEQSLSTFSSHMVNIVAILERVGSGSLVLFDELGGGTDPVEGAALALAIIENVRERGALCLATTHYSELKAYALNTDGVSNASCEFDVETLRPTYRLIIGAPGKSNAFAISGKLGLPGEIIEKAKGYVSADNRNFEDVIGRLENARVEMEANRAEAERIKAEYEALLNETIMETAKKKQEADKLLEVAKSRSAAIMESAKASSNYIFAQLEEVRKKQDKANFGQELDKARAAVRAHIKDNDDVYNPVDERKNDNYVLPRALRKGDTVTLVDIGKQAVVLSVPDASGNLEVQVGIIRTRTKVKNLRLCEPETTFIDKENKKVPTGSYKKQVKIEGKTEIDLRGRTGDEAWMAVDKFLDDAILSGFHTVHLIHGKGTGALKKALWEYLRTDKRIKSYRIGQYGEGDGGVTVVELK